MVSGIVFYCAVSKGQSALPTGGSEWLPVPPGRRNPALESMVPDFVFYCAVSMWLSALPTARGPGD